MKNDSVVGGRKISIPPTLLFSTMARMEDVRRAVTLDPKRPGDLVYLIGWTGAELGGSEFYAMLGGVGEAVPRVDAPAARRLYERVAACTAAGLCRSLHTPALGGLGVALAKKAIAGGWGLEADLGRAPARGPDLSLWELLFAESNSRFVATVAPEHAEAFEKTLGDVPFARAGAVIETPELRLSRDGQEICRIPVSELERAFTQTLNWE